MKPVSTLRCVAIIGLFASAAMVGAQTNFGSEQPSVNSIIDQLKSKPVEGGAERVRTRSLRPGAAAGVNAKASAAPASISLQVQFGFNSSRIEGSSQQTMENLALALASPELQDRRFTIVSHTDGVGSAGYNQRLSQVRARSVKDFLAQRGVAANRLNTVGRGMSDLANRSDPRAAENRRVEIVATSR